MESRKYTQFQISAELHRRELEYKIPEDQCLASGFLPSSFSQFLHHNCIPFVPNIATYASFMNDFSLGDQFSKFFGYGNDKLKEYEAAISCRSMSFWNDRPNKPGFLALHRPAMIENRKKMREHEMATSVQKFRNFNGSTQASISMVDLPSMARIDPRNPLYMNLLQLSNYQKCQITTGGKIDQNDDIRLSESQDGSVIAKDVAVKKLDEKYESDIDIHDDSDW